MKKFLLMALVLILCLGLFVACGQTPADNNGENPGDNNEENPGEDPGDNNGDNNGDNPGDDTPNEGLIGARDYLYAMYKDKAEATPADYTLTAVSAYNGTTYQVIWTVEVTSGDEDGVRIVPAEDGKKVTVDVDERAAAEIVYTLTATIVDGEDSESFTLNRKVPAYVVNTWEDYVRECGESDGDTVVIIAYVTAVNSAVGSSSSSGSMWLQDADGHGYYVYAPTLDSADTASRETLIAAYPVGTQVEVKGTVTTYNGCYEYNKGASVEKTGKTAESEGVTLGYADVTEVFGNAASNKDTAALNPYQSARVTVKGATLTAVSGSYYYFTVNGVQYNLYRNNYFFEDATITELYDKFVVGTKADISGVISVYSNEFQIYPDTVDSIAPSSVSMSDAEKIAVELGNALTVTKVLENTVITLPLTGAAQTDVTFSWALDATYDFVTYDATTGTLTITLPEETTTITLTATATCGDESDSKEFSIRVFAEEKGIYIGKPVETPVADTGYKYGFIDNNGTAHYFTGAVSGNYLVTSENTAEAVEVKLEVSGEGFKLYFVDAESVKTYINVALSGTKVIATLGTDADTASVYTWNSECGAFVTSVTVNDVATDYYIGSYLNNSGVLYTTMSASKTTYITGDNAAKIGVSQFPSSMITLVPAALAAEPVKTPVADTGYKYGFIDNNGTAHYFTGAVSGNYLVTSENTAEAVEVKLEVSGEGFKLYFVDAESVKTYINVALSGTKVIATLGTDADTASVYTWNSECGAFVTSVTVNDVATDYYIGSYLNNSGVLYTTMSASKTTYITGDNAAKIGVSQFPSSMITLVAKEIAPTYVKTPVADTGYKYGFIDNNGTAHYFTGAVSGNYLVTSENTAEAVEVKLEVSGEGFKLYFVDAESVKTYINVALSGTKVIATLGTDADTASVYTWNSECGAFVTSVTVNDVATDYYIGSYLNNSGVLYTTMSASKTTYITGDNAAKIGVSQFPSGMIVMDFVQEESAEEPDEGEGEGEEEPPFVAIPSQLAGSLSFADKANRTSYSTEQQVWVQNGITLTNDKASATSDVADYAAPVKLYAHSSVTIAYTGMTKIVFHCNSTSYATALQNSLSGKTGVNVTVSDKDVTVEFSAACDTFAIADMVAQVRLDSIDVYVAATAAAE